MAKSTGNKIRIERWAVQTPKSELYPDGRKVVTKVAVRDREGKFHGATNFRGSVV